MPRLNGSLARSCPTIRSCPLTGSWPFTGPWPFPGSWLFTGSCPLTGDWPLIGPFPLTTTFPFLMPWLFRLPVERNIPTFRPACLLQLSSLSSRSSHCSLWCPLSWGTLSQRRLTRASSGLHSQMAVPWSLGKRSTGLGFLWVPISSPHPPFWVLGPSWGYAREEWLSGDEDTLSSLRTLGGRARSCETHARRPELQPSSGDCPDNSSPHSGSQWPSLENKVLLTPWFLRPC